MEEVKEGKLEEFENIPEKWWARIDSPCSQCKEVEDSRGVQFVNSCFQQDFSY
jgi:hypothetical protein